MDKIIYIQISVDFFLLGILIFLLVKNRSALNFLNKLKHRDNTSNAGNIPSVKYSQVSSLIEKKISPDDIMATLGVSPAEIRVIRNLKSF